MKIKLGEKILTIPTKLYDDYTTYLGEIDKDCIKSIFEQNKIDYRTLSENELSRILEEVLKNELLINTDGINIFQTAFKNGHLI